MPWSALKPRVPFMKTSCIQTSYLCFWAPETSGSTETPTFIIKWLSVIYRNSPDLIET